MEGLEKEVIVQGINTDGANKKVILKSINDESTGVDKTLAYQVDDGIWREITLSPDGKYYLGPVVRYDGVSQRIQSMLRKLGKLYVRYGSPVVSGASSASRALSGLK